MRKIPEMELIKTLGKLALTPQDKGSFRQVKIMEGVKAGAYLVDSLKEALSNSNYNLQLKLEYLLIMINLLTLLPWVMSHG